MDKYNYFNFIWQLQTTTTTPTPSSISVTPETLTYIANTFIFVNVFFIVLGILFMLNGRKNDSINTNQKKVYFYSGYKFVINSVGSLIAIFLLLELIALVIGTASAQDGIIPALLYGIGSFLCAYEMLKIPGDVQKQIAREE